MPSEVALMRPSHPQILLFKQGDRNAVRRSRRLDPIGRDGQMVRRRGFGEVERRSGPAGVTYRARYTMPDGTRYSRTVGTKLDAEAWLMHERTLIDQDAWTPPTVRKVAEQRRQAQASYNTVGRYAERYLRERQLRPHATLDRDKALAERIGATYDAWAKQRD
jgi:hypothetical protein